MTAAIGLRADCAWEAMRVSVAKLDGCGVQARALYGGRRLGSSHVSAVRRACLGCLIDDLRSELGRHSATVPASQVALHCAVNAQILTFVIRLTTPAWHLNPRAV